MTSRIVILLCLAVTLHAARAVDLEKLPPMDYSDWPKIGELKGRDVEAIDVALRQFRENHFSHSGDLKHFSIELRRRGDKLAVSFFPDLHEPSHLITPARNKYGVWITYFVSLRTLTVVGYTYERD
jgi:hypothetical protein